VQGILDRQRDKRAVRSALELVRTELAANLDDIGILSDYFRQEQASARYLADHEKDLAKCPADSVNYHVGIVNADVSVAFSHDALALLKMSRTCERFVMVFIFLSCRVGPAVPDPTYVSIHYMDAPPPNR
jgi:hypothetical protein